MPKLSLRDLFAAMTIAAILVAWWVDHRRQATAQADLLERNRELEGRHFIYFFDDVRALPSPMK